MLRCSGNKDQWSCVSGRPSQHRSLQLRQAWSTQATSLLTHMYRVQTEGKMTVSSSHRQPQLTRWSHAPKPSISPKTNYPGVRDLTHKFRTAGDSLTLITHQCWSLRTISSVYPKPQPLSKSVSTWLWPSAAIRSYQRLPASCPSRSLSSRRQGSRPVGL